VNEPINLQLVAPAANMQHCMNSSRHVGRRQLLMKMN
jgi:hypothetical protein